MFEQRAKRVIGAVLTASLVMSGTPVAALAAPSDQISAELQTAQATLNSLYAEAEAASENLNDTLVQLSDTEARIADNEVLAEQKQEELDQASLVLAEVVAEDYKNGRPSLASIVFGSASLDEMLNAIYAANKVSEHQQDAIATVREVRSELETAHAELEVDRDRQKELAANQEQYAAELNERAGAAQSYVNGLSAELQEALAAEEAARQAEIARQAEEAARQAQAEAEAQAAAQQQATPADTTTQTQTATENTETAAEEQTPAPAQPQTQTQTQTQPQTQTQTQTTQQTTQPRTTTTPTTTTTARPTTTNTNTTKTNTNTNTSSSNPYAAAVIAAAQSQIGVGYQYGACSPGVAFDCSGLVAYCYSCAGVSVSHASAALAAYCNKPVSQAVPGDILWMPGHVGIYVGGGMTIEAFNPGMPVGYGRASKFVSAGSPA